jgi:hypothetical protein
MLINSKIPHGPVGWRDDRFCRIGIQHARAVSARDVCAILNTHKPRSTRHSLLFFRAADTSFAMLCVDPSSLDGADIM